ncbi:MAG: AAA family ATPase [Aeromicrobium sp.]
MNGVLIAAGGATWESAALGFLESSREFSLARRCVDVADLLAAAQSGDAAAALVSAEVQGFDADTVYRLVQAGVHPVAIGTDSRRCSALGIVTRLEVGELADLAGHLPRQRPAAEEESRPAGGGRIVAVWGPAGAPGRSTVALGLAAAWAELGVNTILADADPYGGAIAQMLGILDEVSGLLAASRAANNGRATETSEHLYSINDSFAVLTGLPRPDLWAQVRAGAIELVLQQLRHDAALSVIDCGFCLEQSDSFDSGAPRRNQLTLQSLEAADDIIAVGRADPVGLTRLVRGLHDLEAALPCAEISVVINMTRPTIGWSDTEIGATVERLTGRRPLAFLPLDQSAADAALIGGRLPREAASDSRLVKAFARLAHEWSTQHSGVRSKATPMPDRW